jgi:hypothetical protein
VDEVIAATTMPDADLRLGETEGAQRRGVELGVTSAGVVLLDGLALLADERLNTSTSPATPGPPTGS